MTDTLPQKWLMVMAGAGMLLCGIRPSILPHVIIPMGFLWLFIWRDAVGRFARPNAITAILFLLPMAYAAAALNWSLIPARAIYDLVIIGLLGWVGVQSTAGMKILSPEDAENLMRNAATVFLAALVCYAADVCFNLPLQRAILHVEWDKPIPLAIVSRACFCLTLLFWPVALFIWQKNMRISAILLWLSVGLLSLFTDSAAGRMAFAVSTATYIMASLSPRILRLMFGVAIVVGFSVAVPVAQIAQNTIGKNVQQISNSFGHRTEIWEFTARRIVEKPVLGWGFNSARAMPNFGEISVYQGNDPAKSIIPMHPHNWFLQVLLELGLVGAVLMGGFWLWILWRTERFDPRVQPAALASVSVIFTIGAFSIGVWQSWWWSAILFVIWVIQWLDKSQKPS